MDFPKYTILERLEAGGMAEVFRGKVSTVEGIQKLVAIKRVLPNLTQNQKFVRMFLDEARLAMVLSHANIVHVYDIGVADGTYFIVMEYVDGTNLKYVCEEYRAGGRRLPLAVTLYIMSEVCKALSYAHEQRDLEGRPLHIVHRDVSPPNILFSRAGEVKLADFGLAKAQSQVESTDPGVVKGKFSYLSPEAAYGEETDTRADIFAVGILLWELLTGRRLFLGESDRDTLELVRRCRVPSLAGTHPDVGEELAGMVEKALARNPDDRWQSASELGDETIRYLFARGLRVSARDVTALVKQFIGTSPPEQPLTGPVVPGVVEQTVREEIALFQSLPQAPAHTPVQPAPREPEPVEASPVRQPPPSRSLSPERRVDAALAPSQPSTTRPPDRVHSLQPSSPDVVRSLSDGRVAMPISEAEETRKHRVAKVSRERAAFDDLETVRMPLPRRPADRAQDSRPVDLRAPTAQVVPPRTVSQLTPVSAVPWWIVLLISAVIMVLSSAATYFILANTGGF